MGLIFASCKRTVLSFASSWSGSPVSSYIYSLLETFETHRNKICNIVGDATSNSANNYSRRSRMGKRFVSSVPDGLRTISMFSVSRRHPPPPPSHYARVVPPLYHSLALSRLGVNISRNSFDDFHVDSNYFKRRDRSDPLGSVYTERYSMSSNVRDINR